MIVVVVEVIILAEQCRHAEARPDRGPPEISEPLD